MRHFLSSFATPIAFCLGSFFWIAATAYAAFADDRQDCVKATNADRVIAACTAAIQTPKDGEPPMLTRLNHAAFYMNRGHAYLQQKNYDQVIADYTEAIELNPNNGRAYNNRGIAYEEKKAHDLAIADYTKSIELDPTDYRPYNNRGWAYQAKGDRERALADYRKALSLNPGDPRIQANIDSLGM